MKKANVETNFKKNLQTLRQQLKKHQQIVKKLQSLQLVFYVTDISDKDKLFFFCNNVS